MRIRRHLSIRTSRERWPDPEIRAVTGSPEHTAARTTAVIETDKEERCRGQDQQERTAGTPWSAATFKSRVIDNDSVRNTSLGTVDFLQLKNNWNSFMNSFDCRSYDASGNLIGRLRWTFPSSCGADPAAGTADMTISGTVFIDGNLSFSGCDKAVYEGRGTIYANGTIIFTNEK